MTYNINAISYSEAGGRELVKYLALKMGAILFAEKE